MGTKIILKRPIYLAGVFLVAADLFTRCYAPSLICATRAERSRSTNRKFKMRFLNNPLIAVISAFVIALILFYLLNHGIMSMQGLPLNADLTPAQ